MGRLIAVSGVYHFSPTHTLPPRFRVVGQFELLRLTADSESIAT